MIELRHTRFTYQSGYRVAKRTESNIATEAEINECLHCKYADCRYGYCDVVGTPEERDRFLNTAYYRKYCKLHSMTI